ncbi:DUF1963 domain-containing protein [Qipengyuania qiaonensis]|uniref:DUF1963 domain-containing protein n=1 Tax=Qipengyuania qiaonensis TaxID=2867240 RepID=A0ABS7JD99_9SPHN|nr:YwqG family protein [Qipengyuania qiaonensis]MBX7483809.1 DUF1963 domain-containing protein [Qipengyuania qiaonensis]
MSKLLPFKSREEKMLDAFVEQNREPAIIILARIADAQGGRRSKFGGLPLLSARTDWPRDPNGKPLHFLAQIDCEELPWHGRLPETGMLSFFGRDDEEQIWEDDVDDPTKNCAVLYDHDTSTKGEARQPPSDLPPIGDGFRRAANCAPSWDGGQCTPHDCKVHVERAIQFHSKPFMTIPETIYHGKAPLAEFGGDGWFQALRGEKSSDAAKQIALEGRLGEAFDKRRREFTKAVARDVFQKDANSNEAFGDYSQMLGYPNTSQGALPPTENSICLLNIASDNSADFYFGDAGFCTFWIAETDLARRDFSQVHGQIEGA